MQHRAQGVVGGEQGEAAAGEVEQLLRQLHARVLRVPATAASIEALQDRVLHISNLRCYGRIIPSNPVPRSCVAGGHRRQDRQRSVALRRIHWIRVP
jgi:hypothetical protein